MTEKAKAKYLSRAMIVLLFMNSLSLLWAAYQHRALFGDGVYFFFRLFNDQFFFWDFKFLRFTSVFLQAPALSWMYLFPSTSTATPSLLYSLAFNLHPFLSLWASYQILIKYNKLELFVFPVLSFALCTQTLMAYPSLISPETISIFWPLFLLTLLRKADTWWEMPVLIALNFAMAFAYETGVIFFSINAGMLLWRLRSEKSVRGDQLIFLLNLAGAAFMVWRLLHLQTASTTPFVRALNESTYREPFRLTGVVMIGWLILAVLTKIFESLREPWIIRLFYPLGIIIIAGFVWFLSRPRGLAILHAHLWLERTTTVPFASAIALCLAIVHFSSFCSTFRGSKLQQGIIFLCCSALAISLIRDLGLTLNWQNARHKIQALVAQNPGCNVISEEANAKLFQMPYSVGGWWLSALTISPEISTKPRSIFIVEKEVTGDACRTHVPIAESTLSLNAINLHNTVVNFDLTEIHQGPILVHTWDETTKSLVSRRIEREH